MLPPDETCFEICFGVFSYRILEPLDACAFNTKIGFTSALLPLEHCERTSLANNLLASIVLPLEDKVFSEIALPDASNVLPLEDSNVTFSDSISAFKELPLLDFK